MEKFVESYKSWMNNESDPRVHSWFLMSSPLPTAVICISYLLSALLLHAYMKQRAAVNIRWMIWGFDIFHLSSSSTLIFIVIKLKLLKDFNFRCQPLDHRSPEGDQTVYLTWWFFVYNFSFFLEIFIFLLGKRHDRITKYFLYHHIALPISIWWVVKFAPTGHSLFFGVVNCATHLMSFGYLSLVGAFPGLKKYFGWWKRFFHTLLIFRILIIVLHASQLFFWNECDYPMIYPFIVVINAPFFIVLTIADHLLHDKRNRSLFELI